MRHPSRIIESMFFSGLILFLIIWMSGVPIIESVELSLLLAIQVSGGAALWYTVNKSQQIELPAAIGMGLALGTSITTLSQYLLRETILSNFSWVIPLFFLIPAISKSRKHSEIDTCDSPSETPKDEYFSLIIILTLVVLAMASLWWWLYPLAGALSCICFLHYQRIKNGIESSAIRFLFLPISVIGIATSVALSQKNTFWKILSNDQVFSESLSWSIFTWGNSDSPFASGTPVNYHWFVLLWSGLTSSATNAPSWVVVGQVLPVISFLGIFCLIWSISKKIYTKFSAPIIAILFLIFYSNSFGFSLTRYIVSPTFLFSCVWLLAFANSAFCFFRNPKYKLALLSSFLLFMTFGGKVMNGAIGISALLFALSIWFVIKKLNPNRIKISAFAFLSVISLVLIYFFMYSQNQPGNLNTLIIRSLLPLQLGLLPPEKDGIYLILVNLFLFISMMLPLTAIGIYSTKRIFRERFEVWFVVGSILSGLILTFMTSHPGASQLYFWLASLVFAALMIPAIFYDGVSTKFKMSRFIPYVLIALIAAVVNIEFWNRSNLNQTGYESLKLKTEGLLIGLIFIFVFASSYYLIAKNSKSVKFRYGHIMILSLFVLFNLGIGVKQQITNLIDRSQIQMSDENDRNLITGSRNHLQILNWIRANTDESDVVATNRFCIPGLSYCISKWQLVSAVSHRKMLFEGGYYELPNIPDQELFRRYVLSSEFGPNPSPLGLNRLCRYGVKWYFYDHSVAEPLKTWEPYAAVQLQNEGVSLLRLRCPTN